MKTRSYVFIEKLYKKILELRQAECNLIVFALRFFYYYVFYGKIILAHQKARIINPKNIEMPKGSKLSLGIGYRGFTDKHDRTLLNIRGKLILKGSATIHKGVRIDVCEGAVLEIGAGVGINSFTKIICKDRISIGENTGIGWDCNFLDGDFHNISIGKLKMKNHNQITIGKHALIGNNVSIGKGVTIADGCIVPSDSIIKGKKFTKPNQLILSDREIPNVSWE